MPPIETKTIISEVHYVTKPRDGGGFIAHPSDPNMEVIEGATENEIQQKVLAALTTVMDRKGLLKNLLSGAPVDVKLNSRSTVIFNPDVKTILQFTRSSKSGPVPVASDAPVPIQFERNRVFLPVVLAIIAVAAILFIVLR